MDSINSKIDKIIDLMINDKMVENNFVFEDKESYFNDDNINNDIIKLYPENADEIVYQLKEVTEFKSKILNDVFLSHFIDIIESIQCTKYENDIPAFTYTL
jgi:hypothetical protein